MHSVPITTDVVGSTPAQGEVYNGMWQFSGFLRVLLFPPPMKLTHNITEILLKVALNTIKQNLNKTKPRSAGRWLKGRDVSVDEHYTSTVHIKYYGSRCSVHVYTRTLHFYCTYKVLWFQMLGSVHVYTRTLHFYCTYKVLWLQMLGSVHVYTRTLHIYCTYKVLWLQMLEMYIYTQEHYTSTVHIK